MIAPPEYTEEFQDREPGIRREDLPLWASLSDVIMTQIEEDSLDILPWMFCRKFMIADFNMGLRENYPTRELFGFAFRVDTDIIACFEKSKPGKVVIIYNDDVGAGFERGPEFISFQAWYEYAKKSGPGDVDFDDVPGIDFYPVWF